MRYAETGFNLEIDLSRGSIERVETDPRLTALHLGGQGTAGKILWDRVGPEVDPFSPDNLLIFSTRHPARHARARRQSHLGRHLLPSDEPVFAFAVRRILRTGD